ncbi:MAG: glycine cleavage T C-terminal barrel domain-containing protein [Haloarculaceae archaeon]
MVSDQDPEFGGADALDVMRRANRREDFSARRPSQYTNWIDEQLSWKETCYVGSWSSFANLTLEGPDAIDLLADLSINSFADYPVGGGKHLVQCDENANVVAEGVLVREGEETFVVHGVPCYWSAHNLETGDYDATCEFRDTFNYGIQGPNSLEVLDALGDHSLRDVGFMRSGEVEVAGVDVTAVRFGMSGELGFELHGPGEHSETVWNAILDAGEEYGIRRLSSGTSSINQLEAGIPSRVRDFVSAIFGDGMAGYRAFLREHQTRDLITHAVEGSFEADDISDYYRTPVELGWDRYTKFDHDFVGREALEAEAADRVLRDGADVGVATMRGYSYYFRQMLSLATVDVEHADPGTEVTVLWGEGENRTSPTVEDHVQTEVRATVAETPYKEDRRREDISSTE